MADARRQWTFSEAGPIVQIGEGAFFYSTVDVALERPNQPTIAFRLIVENGEPACTTVVIARTERSQLTDATYRSLDGLTNEAIQKAAGNAALVFHRDQLLASAAGQMNAELAARLLQARTDPVLRRHRGASDEDLRRVAQIYKTDRTGAPTEEVADQLGISKRTATRWVGLARDAGYLPPYGEENSNGD